MLFLPLADQQAVTQAKMEHPRISLIDQATTPLIFLYIGPGAGLTFAGSFLILLAALAMLLVLVATWPLRVLCSALWRRQPRSKGAARRVVVIGLDGLDPKRARRLMDDGRLPNFTRLAQVGTFSDLQTTLPPMSPVAWSSFQTGVNPGKHGIFDFLKRNPQTYLPELSSVRIQEPAAAKGWRRWIWRGGAAVRMLRKSQPFWRILGEHGVFSTILRVPITFPPEPFFGHSLSAMCTPDLRGTQGSFTLLTTDVEAIAAPMGGLRILLQAERGGWIASLPGPPSSNSGDGDLQVLIRLRITGDGNSVRATIGKTRITLKLNEASGWTSVSFARGMFGNAQGICELRLASIQPHLCLYVSPIHIDPGKPVMPISHPPLYSLYLRKLHGPFATLGLAEDTWGLNSGALTEAAFLEQAWSIHDERERMLLEALKCVREGLTVCVFDGPDRIQHMFYRHDVPDHPANDSRDTLTHARVIDEMYMRMDELVGRVAGMLRRDDVLIVLSDHGFCDFSRGMNLNIWLRDQGYLSLLPGAEAQPADYLGNVDWGKTRAYAFGLNGIYINQAGRERQGIVSAADAPRLRTEIQRALTGIRDPERNQRAIRSVQQSRAAYAGPYVDDSPDLIIGYESGYRASWENVVGRIEGALFTDNTRLWSGDHCVDPEVVPGLLLLNRSITSSHAPALIDLAPTILELFGIAAPAYMDGQPLSLAPVGVAPDPPARRIRPEPSFAEVLS